jgi:hypothetical protein
VAYDVLRQRCLLCRLLRRFNRMLYRDVEAVISLGEVMTQRLEAAGVDANRLYTVHNWTPGEGVIPIVEKRRVRTPTVDRTLWQSSSIQAT